MTLYSVLSTQYSVLWYCSSRVVGSSIRLLGEQASDSELANHREGAK